MILMTQTDQQQLHNERLREALAASGLTQTEFADQLGVSQPTVSMWLSGDRRPDRKIIGKVASLLRVSATWLDYGEGEGPREDLAAQRAEYRRDVEWTFRREQPDGSRDFGNANIFSFDPTIGTFVREVLQNVGDASSGGPVAATFTIRRLRGTDVDSFLDALGWTEFRPHLEASIKSGQQVGSALEAGVRAADSKELVILEIGDSGTTGLLGADVGVGNFAALCRNNLDSNKASGQAGGSYGLGKAVLWRMSSFSTVLFLSNLVEAAPDSGKSSCRFIGRTELVWHELDGGEAFAGPGWLGTTDPSEPNRPLSFWENRALAKDLHFARDLQDPGTSILVVGFRDPSSDVDQSPAEVADLIEAAVTRHFWPALTRKSLSVSVQVAEGDAVTRAAEVEIESVSPELAELLESHRNDEVTEALLETGDVVRVSVPLEVPACSAPGSEHLAFVHTAYALIRRADPADDSPTVGRGQFFRGPGMVVFETDFSRILVGAQPFHAAVLCGAAAGDSTEDLWADRFLQTAEPPAHHTWEITEKLQREYARGSGAAIARFRDAVRQAIKNTLMPAVDNPPDGPRDLAALFRFGEPTKPERAPRLIVDSARVNERGAWTIEGTIRVPAPKERVVGRPVLVFEGETGSGTKTEWARLEPVKDCTVEKGTLVVAPGKRTARFRGETDPATHPIPVEGASVNVDFRAVREEVSA